MSFSALYWFWSFHTSLDLEPWLQVSHCQQWTVTRQKAPSFVATCLYLLSNGWTQISPRTGDPKGWIDICWPKALMQEKTLHWTKHVRLAPNGLLMSEHSTKQILDVSHVSPNPLGRLNPVHNLQLWPWPKKHTNKQTHILVIRVLEKKKQTWTNCPNGTGNHLKGATSTGQSSPQCLTAECKPMQRTRTCSRYKRGPRGTRGLRGCKHTLEVESSQVITEGTPDWSGLVSPSVLQWCSCPLQA